jgi:hypothetical protein
MGRRSKRTSNRARRMPRNDRHSGPEIDRIELDSKAVSELLAGRGRVVPSLPNMHDNLVVQNLTTVKIGDLPVDRFASLLCKNGHTPRKTHVIELRLALIRGYFVASNARRYSKANRIQINGAQSALTAITAAVGHLDQVRPSRQRGLQSIFGSPMDDPKGLDELNDFGSKCSNVRMDIVPIMMSLSRAIEIEKAKLNTNKAGERKKRLRTLVEALVVWWASTIQKAWAPYVKANRRDHAPAVMHGRSGLFIDLAQAIFAGVDEFKESEVISAITNVHESRLPKKARRQK